MAAQASGKGGMFDSGTTVNVLTFGKRNGSILNLGTATVYGKWDDAAGPTAADGTAEDGKWMLAQGASLRVPSGTTKTGHKTAASAAVLLYVAD